MGRARPAKSSSGIGSYEIAFNDCELYGHMAIKGNFTTSFPMRATKYHLTVRDFRRRHPHIAGSMLDSALLPLGVSEEDR